MPPICASASAPPLTGLVLWNLTPIAGASNNDVIVDWNATSPTSIDWHRTSTGAVYKTNVINGQPAIFFDGTSGGRYDTSGETLTTYQALTAGSMYIVGMGSKDPDTAATHGGLYVLSDTTSAGFTQLSAQSGIAQESTFTTSTRTIGDLAQSYANPFIHGVLSATNNYKVRMNGVEVFSNGTNTFETMSVNNLLLGFIQTGGGNFDWKGYIAEILVYDHVLDAGEISQLESYLANKFSITIPYATPATPSATSRYLWLDAGTLSLSDSDPVDSWTDLSGNGFHFTGSGGTRPVFRNTSVTINSLPVIVFDGTDDILVNNSLDTDAWSGATIFAVGRFALDPPVDSAKTGLWDFNTSDLTTVFPFTDSNCYDGTFTSARKSTGNPTPSLASAYVMSITSGASNYCVRFNGTPHFFSATNTFEGRNTGTNCVLGKSSTANFTAFMNGVFAEIILYEGALGDGARDAVEAYLRGKYNI